MRSFDEIHAIAAEKKGGAEALEALLPKPKAAGDLAAIPDHRWLAAFSRVMFATGMNWKVIEAKWDGIEEAFHNFDIGRCAMMDDTWFDELMGDRRIIRHGGKVQAVRDNATMLQELAATHGSAARAIADWPAEDFTGLLDYLKTHGSRLGGSTGAYALRFQGKESFIMSRDVVARLVEEGVIDKPPTSKKAMAAVQAAFNEWRAQSGRSLSEISRVLAASV